MFHGQQGGVLDLFNKTVDYQHAACGESPVGVPVGTSSSSFFNAAQFCEEDNGLSDWFSGGLGADSIVAGACESRLSSLGEPATPNGVDFLSAYSPHLGFAGHRASSSGPAVDDNTLAAFGRCSYEYAGSPDRSQRDLGPRRSEPVPVRGRFLSAPAADAIADLSGGGRTAFVNALLSQLAAADSRVSRLEQQLREQRAASEALALQLQERNAQLAAARLERLQHASNAAEQDCPRAQPPHERAVGPPGHAVDAVPCASEEGCSGEGWPQGTPATEPPLQLPGGAQPCAQWLVGQHPQLLMRLDTPAVPYEGPVAGARRASTPAEAAKPPVAAGSPCLAAPHEGAATCAAGLHDALGAPAFVRAPAAADRHPAQLLHQQLLAAERRRTDAAHRALLVSSRQAQRLSSQLAAVTVRAASLQEELLDWRGAALDNHKVIARLRRGAAA
ncbi:hypothetical protein TSOC_003679 [Tetrabaena socialis]|uniref:Uncharacterized protein n=1 Tax=Tetrabaena socialis TaxID=47790 RepID=A0A2J8AAY8_9CHLO|nr:hypothetical protein TSOC_003679 [Tetrabaena socialis]|eukprot:PNH09691.1 hypothetical protein TSOC_003679 [Tetrabaena socialis]